MGECTSFPRSNQACYRCDLNTPVLHVSVQYPAARTAPVCMRYRFFMCQGTIRGGLGHICGFAACWLSSACGSRVHGDASWGSVPDKQCGNTQDNLKPNVNSEMIEVQQCSRDLRGNHSILSCTECDRTQSNRSHVGETSTCAWSIRVRKDCDL